MADTVNLRCPNCKAALRISRAAIEERVACTNCGKSFRVASRMKAPDAAPPTPITPVAAKPASDFDFDAGPIVVRPAITGTGASPGRKLLAVAILSLAVAAGGGFALYRTGLVGNRPASESSNSGSARSPADRVALPAGDSPASEAKFPRRFLFIGAHQYVYMNPIGPTPTELLMPSAIRELATQKLRVDKEQVYVVSDLPTETNAVPPLKVTIERTVEQFLGTCRPQDRILIVFVGHAVDVDGQAYLVPLDGELENKSSLVPLQWLYDRLGACAARQKVLVIDTARYDSARGFEMPGSGPLSAKLDVALANPPPGVQVWSACVAGQYSYEFELAKSKTAVTRGGVFLSLVLQAFSKGGNLQKPEEALPLEFLTQHVHAAVAEVVAARENGAQQTPRLAGSEPASGADYDGTQPMPTRFELPRPGATAGGAADPKEMQALMEEIAVPPIRLPREAGKEASPSKQSAALAAAFPFTALAMKPYAADYRNLREVLDKPKDYPLRIAVLNTVEALDRQGRLGRIRVGDKEVSADRLIETVRNRGNDDSVKKSLTKSQESGPALMLVELQDMLEAMEKAGKARDREPSMRWQAHYDYVLAQLKMRMAFVHEYDTVLAKVKRDELPKLDPKLHNGWRLAAQEKLQSPKEVRDLANDAKKILAKLMQDHPGTPWEVLAKRARSTALGLAWQPTSLSDK